MSQTRPHPVPHNVPFELRENRKESRHCAARRRSQIQRLRHRNKAHAERRQFLQCRHQVGDRPASPIQPPHQHDINVTPSRGIDQPLSYCPRGCARAHLLTLFDNGPATLQNVLPQRPYLQGKCLLIQRGDARIHPRPQHSLLFACLAKNPVRFRLSDRLFGGHFRSVAEAGRKRWFSATTPPRAGPTAPALRGSSRASIPLDPPATLQRAAATRSGSRTDWRR